MDINQITEELDRLFAQEKIDEIPQYLESHIAQAEAEGARDVLLTLYNEIIGFYRETGQYDLSIKNCHKAMALMDGMGLQDTIPYATTLLNAANAHRAAGLLRESLDLYNRVRPIYVAQLDEDDLYFASFYNNLSLLYQEMGDFGSAKEQLENALFIVNHKPDKQFEVAVTQANLANTCIELKQDDEAKARAEEAIRIFEEIGVHDAHYSAALSALGSLYYMDKDYQSALDAMEKSRECVAKYLGTDNLQYQRLSENIEIIKNKMGEKPEKTENPDTTGTADADPADPEPEVYEDLTPEITGLELCRRYYEEYGRPMIAEKFQAYESVIAVGLVGKGSDCFGFDDILSQDHDYGPRFVMWVTKKVYDEIGKSLQEAYDKLPRSYMGIGRIETFHGKDRSGVMVIEEFYKNVLGVNLVGLCAQQDEGSRSGKEELEVVKSWLSVQDHALAAAVNGEVFRDDEGIFTKYRNMLQAYYPKAVWYRKIAQACAMFSQSGQYNLPRLRRRRQLVAAELAKAECAKQAMRLHYLLNRVYAPHNKWLFRGLPENPRMVLGEDGMEREESVPSLVEKISMLPVDKAHEVELTTAIESLAVIFANELEKQDIVGKCDLYLDACTKELTMKSDTLLTAAVANTPVITALALSIAKAEFEAFDKVQNEGGRADCQNNWPTFKIMRMSQYMTWTEDMLLQYLYEFHSNYEKGRNMIQEKYARMMESTAPLEYACFADTLPVIPEQKKAVIEQIVTLQVKWMEEFAAEYPGLAEDARMIHTAEDLPYETSYETYLRGELGTYSDRMLEMYGHFIVSYAQQGRNLAREIMENTVRFYGYQDLETANAAKNGVQPEKSEHQEQKTADAVENGVQLENTVQEEPEAVDAAENGSEPEKSEHEEPEPVDTAENGVQLENSVQEEPGTADKVENASEPENFEHPEPADAVENGVQLENSEHEAPEPADAAENDGESGNSVHEAPEPADAVENGIEPETFGHEELEPADVAENGIEPETFEHQELDTVDAAESGSELESSEQEESEPADTAENGSELEKSEYEAPEPADASENSIEPE